MAQGVRIKSPVKPGNRYGRLVVIEKHHMDAGNSFWLCKCDCGNTKIVRTSFLTWGQTRSCGCLYNETRGIQKRLADGVAVFNHLYGQYKRVAKKRGYSFELSKAEFARITKQDCYYCGRPPSQVARSEYAAGDYIYNGIDRTDNSKGYVLTNVVPCCGDCNQMKSGRSVQDFLQQVESIYTNSIA